MSSIERPTMIVVGKGNINILVVKVMKILRPWKGQQRTVDNGDKNSVKNLFKNNFMSAQP